MSVSSATAALLPQAALRPVALGLSLLALAGGHAAWEATAHDVTITVDGARQQVTTHGDTVGAALDAAGVEVGSHDLLVPAADTRLTDSTSVVLRRGRQLALTVDGKTRDVWVTALSVDEALTQLDMRGAGSVLSADRSRQIPLKGFSLDVRTRKSVQVLDAGKVRAVATNTLQVSELLAELKVRLSSSDKLSVRPTTAVTDGMVIRITRIVGKQVSEDVAIPFATERRPDSSMYKGQKKTLRPGRVGVLHKTYALTYTNGKLTGRRLASTTKTAAPVNAIVAYGTKERPYSVAGADGLNWPALARCESGGNPRAVSSGGTYRGLYQFTMGTWRAYGGQGDPIDASSSEQTYRAKLLYKARGRSPWPSCGKYL